MSLSRDLRTLLQNVEALERSGQPIPGAWKERVRRLRSLIAGTAGKNAAGVSLELQKASPFRVTAADLDEAQRWWRETAPESAQELIAATLNGDSRFRWDPDSQQYLERIS